MLHFGFEGQRISVSNILSSLPDLIGIRFSIGTILAHALLIAIPSSSEALTVHLEALRFGAFAHKILNSRASLFQ